MTTPASALSHASSMLLIGAHLADMRRRNKRPGTIRQRGYHLRRFNRFVQPSGILHATEQQAEEWIFDTRALAPESQATDLSQLNGFYRWAIDLGLISVSPCARLHRPALRRRIPRPIPDGDLAMAIALAPPLRLRPWLLLAAYAGLRCSEIAQLRVDDCFYDADPAVIIVSESKGGDMTVAALSGFLAEQLGRCDLPGSGWMFPRRDGRAGHVPGHLVSQLTNEYLHDLGITATIHKARHWFGTETLRASGGNIRVAQEALRHRSIASTQIYTAIRPVAVADAVSRLPALIT